MRPSTIEGRRAWDRGAADAFAAGEAIPTVGVGGGMERAVDGESPSVADPAFVSEIACLVGDIDVRVDASLRPFVYLRGDIHKTVVGREGTSRSFPCSTAPGSATASPSATLSSSTTPTSATMR